MSVRMWGGVWKGMGWCMVGCGLCVRYEVVYYRVWGVCVRVWGCGTV